MNIRTTHWYNHLYGLTFVMDTVLGEFLIAYDFASYQQMGIISAKISFRSYKGKHDITILHNQSRKIGNNDGISTGMVLLIEERFGSLITRVYDD